MSMPASAELRDVTPSTLPKNFWIMRRNHKRLLRARQRVNQVALRAQKAIAKEAQRANIGWDYQPQLVKARQEARYRHIAYSLLKGRTMEQIENKTREGNEPKMAEVDRWILLLTQPLMGFGGYTNDRTILEKVMAALSLYRQTQPRENRPSNPAQPAQG